MNLDPTETTLIGKWISDNPGGYVADDMCRRIDSLVRAHWDGTTAVGMHFIAILMTNDFGN
jgi:hypothetical protein